jgi:hypothetical protein
MKLLKSLSLSLSMAVQPSLGLGLLEAFKVVLSKWKSVREVNI